MEKEIETRERYTYPGIPTRLWSATAESMMMMMMVMVKHRQKWVLVASFSSSLQLSHSPAIVPLNLLACTPETAIAIANALAGKLREYDVVCAPHSVLQTLRRRRLDSTLEFSFVRQLSESREWQDLLAWVSNESPLSSVWKIYSAKSTRALLGSSVHTVCRRSVSRATRAVCVFILCVRSPLLSQSSPSSSKTLSLKRKKEKRIKTKQQKKFWQISPAQSSKTTHPQHKARGNVTASTNGARPLSSDIFLLLWFSRQICSVFYFIFVFHSRLRHQLLQFGFFIKSEVKRRRRSRSVITFTPNLISSITLLLLLFKSSPSSTLPRQSHTGKSFSKSLG